MNDSALLMRYKTLIFLSLEAQENNDVELEERTIDALDIVWSKLSHEERLSTNAINRQAVAWFNAGMRRTARDGLGLDSESVTSASRALRLGTHQVDVFESPDVRFERTVVSWGDSLPNHWLSSSCSRAFDLEAAA